MNETILLLEDDFSLVDGLTYALQKNGFRPEVARTVKEANVLLASLGELCSRIRAQLRRTSLTPQDTVSALVCGDLTIDRLNHRAVLKDVPLELTGAEYKLLSLLVQNAGQTLTRDMIFDKLWDGTGKYVDDNTLSVYIRRLREKVEAEPSAPEHLITVRGFGYQWKEGSS